MRDRARMQLIQDASREPRERRLPDDVRGYLLRLLTEKTTPPPRKGRPSTKYRDYWIVQVLARLVASPHSLTPTRNREQSNNPRPRQQLTACGVVATVLGELAINLSEASVETIWSRRPDDVVDYLPVGGPSLENEERLMAGLEAWLVSPSVREK